MVVFRAESRSVKARSQREEAFGEEIESTEEAAANREVVPEALVEAPA